MTTRTNDGRNVEIIDRLDDSADSSETFLVRELVKGRAVGFPFQASMLWSDEGDLVLYPLDVLAGME